MRRTFVNRIVVVGLRCDDFSDCHWLASMHSQNCSAATEKTWPTGQQGQARAGFLSLPGLSQAMHDKLKSLISQPNTLSEIGILVLARKSRHIDFESMCDNVFFRAQKMSNEEKYAAFL